MSEPSDSVSKNLVDLQLQLSKELLRKIKSGEATAADLAVARQYLKDNDIQTPVGADDNMDELTDKLGDVDVDADPYKLPETG